MPSYYNNYKFLSLLCLISLAQSHNNGAGVTIDLIHRDSPLSPSHDPSKTRIERLRDAFERSFSRKSSLLSSNSVDAVVDAPVNRAGGEYLIEYRIGTPPVRQLGIVDTGSDLTWIQCKPCTNCYKQEYPLFDPRATKSYRPASCQENACAYGGGLCGGDTCQYDVAYGDTSYSKGDLASDTLTLASKSIPNFFFGCGRNNSGSGIFGLGTGVLSVVTQLAETAHGRFSYCLTPPDSNASGKISFGNDAVVAGPNVLSTPLVSKDPDILLAYFVNLEGFSVGKQRFDYGYNSSKQVSRKDGNIVIDTGSTLTFVAQEVYQGIEAALVKAIKATRAKDPKGTLGLCYKSEGEGGLASPPITAHFQGADILLPEGSTFVEVEKGVVCFTVAPSKDVGVFGNLHQAGYLIGYDLVKKQVSFLKTDCTKRR